MQIQDIPTLQGFGESAGGFEKKGDGGWRYQGVRAMCAYTHTHFSSLGQSRLAQQEAQPRSKSGIRAEGLLAPPS